MLIAYLLISLSTVLFSCQFLFQRRYNALEGAGIYPSMLFSLVTSVVKVLLVLVLYGFRGTVTPLGSLIALAAAADTVMNVFFSAGAFRYANMSLYTLFMMLGGMALPFVFGVLCFSEGLTVPKILCCILTAAALFFGASDLKVGEKRSSKAILFYVGVFVTNGLSGVLAKTNQSVGGMSSNTYLLFNGLWTMLICGVYVAYMALFRRRKLFVSPAKSILSASLFGLVSSLGNLFVLIALETLPASVQFPVITGGTIIVSTLIAALRKEKLKVRNYIAVAVALVASCIVIL